jgi:hypothetical protein
MRSKLEAKLGLDGVSFDELTLKPNLSNLLRLRFSALRDQLGYKLPELLEARVRDERGMGRTRALREVLVGDDSESDAFVYSLYADLCAGNVGAAELERVLEAGELPTRAILRCRRALSELERRAAIDCILIHLDAQTPPSLFLRYGPRLVPFFNYLQAAFVLLERGFLNGGATLRIASEFLAKYGFSPDTVGRSYADLARRGHATHEAPRLLEQALGAPDAALPDASRAELEQVVHSMQLPGETLAPLSRAPRLDYVELAALHRGGKNRRRPGQRFF